MESKKVNKNLFVRTPLIESIILSQSNPRKVYLKLENCQPSGSFKMRGISRLCQQGRNNGSKTVIGSSGGNAGLAMACSARLLGMKCKIFVPKTTCERMREKIEREGAVIEIAGSVWNESHIRATQVFAESDASVYVHPFDNPIIWSGHSTMIDEIAEDIDSMPSMIVSCCGGGGLLCGIIEGMRRHGWNSVPLVAMETTGADSLNAAVRAGGYPVTLPAITSVAKCLGSLVICDQLAKYYRESAPPVLSHLLEDRDAVDATIRLANEHRILVEPACGATLAALYTDLVKHLFQQNSYSDGPIIVIVCGGASICLEELDQLKKQFCL